jgi:hypothetical protein
VGVNDLSTTNPEIAALAVSWDPTTVTADSYQRRQFACSNGHVKTYVVRSIVRSGPGICTPCTTNAKKKGESDLATTHPEIAALAVGWDPSTVTAGSALKRLFRCPNGHPPRPWQVMTRANSDHTKCRICTGLEVLVGVNDLATTHPGVAALAVGWDPTTVALESRKRRLFACPNGHGEKMASSLDQARDPRIGCRACSKSTLVVGTNDLATTHPEIAALAVGWDPSTVTAGSGQRRMFACPNGHPARVAIVLNMSRSARGECKVCTRHEVLVGINDLATTHPVIAALAEGWDPKTVTAGSAQERLFRCPNGHDPRMAPVANRAKTTGCSVCTGHDIVVGVNDLATTHPGVAACAVGWDPTSITAGSNQKRLFSCPVGHPPTEWIVANRVKSVSLRCRICEGREILVGVNDLATTHPDVAALAVGWDPTTVTAGSDQKRLFNCPGGHAPRLATVNNVARKGRRGCKLCGTAEVVVGVNDLTTTHPDVAALAVGWDPTSVTAESRKSLLFACPNGHEERLARPFDRTRENRVGCTECIRRTVQPGVNDLATTHPDVAVLAVGWDPTTVVAGSNARRLFTCVSGHPARSMIVFSAVKSGGRCKNCPPATV